MAAALTIPLLVGAAPAPVPAPAPARIPHGVTVSVAVTALRNHDGMVMACMTTNEGRFPRCRGDTASYQANVPADHAPQTVIITFPDVRPGTYAIALLHDENGNGRADKTAMIPREGFGFSRDARVRMGPPTFADAAFTVGTRPVQQTIRMRYML
ncbi:hypothetical protein PK98_12075 [Croceibacterium mercuriale]|uniref:DUF2141 domain-containing protein n=1 Tax=Croceibacterium mercuriale TaxID=1572751 RepID=A0A0B2BZI4_9SPHN|nr:hypothetical protein PK98_12075 [Croceibacterium mercuriale]